MEEMTQHGQVGRAAMVADMDRKTARKYIGAGQLPSEMAKPRQHRTRPDPFEEHWPKLCELLEKTPELEAKTLFQLLCEEHPGCYQESQLRTLQRRVKQWRAQQGPAQEVFFAQAHRPGEALQTDFTSTSELGVTLEGQPLKDLLCVQVLPFSNWQWATVCESESLAALRRGLQAALFQLGRVPQYHQTDNSTAATHRLSREQVQEGQRKRPFNEAYLGVMKHFGLTPRTIEVGCKEQNGDVESSHGALKRRLEQALLVRGHRDFEDRASFEQFVQEVVRKANAARGDRVSQELSAMRVLDVSRLPEFTEIQVRVSQGSTIQVKGSAYSVPSRLIGEQVKVRIFEERVEVLYAGRKELSVERLRGRHKRHLIDYRHVIWSLVRKPGAFARYVYREEMFPSLVFRRCYDALQAAEPGTGGDLEYLRILHLAASTLESKVEAALEQLLGQGQGVTVDGVKALCKEAGPERPWLEPAKVDLQAYDELLQGAS